MKKTCALIMAVLMLVCTFTACGKSKVTDWEYIEQNGKLVIGLDDTFAPMGFRDKENKLVGFDIDLATEVGKILGIEVEFSPIDWTGKEMALDSKRVDCLWNGMSATETRQKEMSLTNKYMNNELIIGSFDANINVKTAADLVALEKGIGIQGGSSALEMVQADPAYDTFKDKIVEYDTYDEALLDMKAGRLDVVVIDLVFFEYTNTQYVAAGNDAMTLSEYTFGDDFYAVGCRKDDTVLAGKITDAIQQLIDNGKAEEISNKWFGRNIVICEGYDK